MTQVQTAENSLAFTDQGTGPCVVVLHGLFGSLSNLGRLARELASDHRVLCLDLPGHGLSAHAKDYAHETMATTVLETIRSLTSDSFHLIGHSLGGKIAMQLASQSPQDAGVSCVDSLVVVDIAPRDYPAHHDDIFRALNSVPLSADTNQRKAESLLAQHIDDAGIRAFLLKSFRTSDRGEREWQFDLNGLQAQYETLSASPSLPHTVECPTLFIKGANSDYLLPQDEARIRRAFSRPEFKIIHGTAHWPHAEKPDAFNALVRRFLSHHNPPEDRE